MSARNEATPARHQLIELEPAECWSLLRQRPVGHLVWQRADGPFAVPVNYAVDGDGEDAEIVLHTSAYSSIARECDDALVAFAVDDLAVDSRTGWNVLVRGRAHIDWDGIGRSDAVDPWPEGVKPLRLRITAASVSGRFVGDPAGS